MNKKVKLTIHWNNPTIDSITLLTTEGNYNDALGGDEFRVVEDNGIQHRIFRRYIRCIIIEERND